MEIYEGKSLILKGEKWELGVTKNFPHSFHLLNECTFCS